MKRYVTLLESLPAKTVVFAFGRFNPPTTGHELLIKLVKKLAQSQGADYYVYASATQDKKKNPLSITQKIHYLKLMFPGTNFAAAGGDQRTFMEVAKYLNKKYKNLVMVAGSDRVPEYQKLLEKYNGTEFHFDSVKVVSAGERDPDADDASGMSASKMRAAASKGDFVTFKKGLPSSVREIDGKRLMNDIREGMGMDAIKEQIVLSTDVLREKYFRKEIFHIGDIVESAGKQFEIISRGSNYLTVVDSAGETSKKWIHECMVVQKNITEDISPGPAPAEISFKGFTTKNLHHSADAAKAFQDTITRYGAKDPATVLAALKATDTYMKLNDMHLEQGKAPDEGELKTWRDAHAKARDSLNRVGEFMHHQDYWHMHEHEIQDMETQYNPETAGAEMADSYTPEGNMVREELTDRTIKANDKVKVARVIADMLGVENAESMSPEIAVNTGLRKIKTKRMTPELIGIVKKMTELATEVGIKFDPNLVPAQMKEAADSVKKNVAPQDIMRYKDFLKMHKPGTPNTEVDGENPAEAGHSLDVGDSDHVRRMKVKYKTEGVIQRSGTDKVTGEDVQSADYKVNPSTGRKSRAHHIEFQNSDDDQGPIGQDLNKNKAVKHKKNAPLLKTIGEEVSEEDEFEDPSEEEMNSMVDSIREPEHVLDAYDDEELTIVDSDTGEQLDTMKEQVQQINEVLSRMERMKAKIRFARTASKRERRVQIALKTRSSAAKINQRARRLAVSLMKQRIIKKPADQLSVAEKERVERIIARRKEAVGRLAMKLAPRVRKIENDRLSHSAVTK